MHIAQQVKAVFVTINSNNGNESFSDFNDLIQEADNRATFVTQCDEPDITEYDFSDGSVMVLNSSDETAFIYASR